MRVLAVTHGRRPGGAQEAMLENLKMLRRRGVDINVLTCHAADGADRGFLSDIEKLGIATFVVPQRQTHIGFKYPDLEVEQHAELIKSSDIVWITDVEYLVAPRIKRIRRDIPVVAYIPSNSLVCPLTFASYGMRETCTENCFRSLRRFARCKRLSQQYMAQWHLKSTRLKVYQFLNFPKTCVEFVTWPMNRVVVESIDGWVAISPFTRDFMRSHLQQLGWDRDVPMEVIPNAVMMPEPIIAENCQDDGREILYASGSGIWKGPHIVLSAARQLLNEGSKGFTITMLGVQGDDWIKGLVRRLQIERHVKLLPWLPRKEVGGLMVRSAVVLLPALTPEPLPRVPIEANLLGTPAIVSNRGALPYTIVDRVTGLVTEPSVEAMAKCVDDALRTDWNPEVIARTAKERFDPARLGGDLVCFLESFV